MTGNREPYGGVWQIADDGAIAPVAEWATPAEAEAWLIENEKEATR